MIEGSDQVYHDYEYLKLLQRILDDGEIRSDRTGTGTQSIFGHQMSFDLQLGFPLLTTKKVHTKSIFAELLWMLSGSTNVRDLQEQGVTIWDEWADKNGELGPVYGGQWRSWESSGIREHTDPKPIDQIQNVINQIKTDPFSRRHIVTAWNPGDLEYMALPPCHMMFQFYVNSDFMGNPYSLSCQLYQRSGDVFLGVPFNIASYAALTTMVAQAVGLVPGRFIHTLGDAHIYLNHMDQVKEQLSREALPSPHLVVDRVPSIFDITMNDIHVVGYDSHPAIKAPVAV